MKAILVIDMPNNCDECPANYDYIRCKLDRRVELSLKDDRPSMCPLKPMPKRNEYRADTSYDQMKPYDTGYADGWNDCLKEIAK